MNRKYRVQHKKLNWYLTLLKVDKFVSDYYLRKGEKK
jgi:hypothetical protein